MQFNKYQKTGAYFYFLILIYITFFLGARHSGHTYENKINLELLGSKRFYLKNYDTLNFYQKKFIVQEILGNILLFVPFAAALFVLAKRQLNVLPVIIVLFLAIISIELLQYLFNVGVFDIDDIVLNFIGGLIGLVVFKFFFRKYILR